MSELIVKEKEVVVPGDKLAQGMDYLPSEGTYREGEDIVCQRTGMVKIEGKVIKIKPLSGEYIPSANDTIIGQVQDVSYSGWQIDTFSPYQAVLSMSEGTSEYVPRGADLTKYYDIGDLVVVKVTNVNSMKFVDVSTKGPGLKKLGKGRVIRVNSNKVPRVIGTKGSMVNIIKKYTNTDIIIGQNGVIWISGEDPKKESLAEEAIKKIECEAHMNGLTDKIEKWFNKGEQK